MFHASLMLVRIIASNVLCCPLRCIWSLSKLCVTQIPGLAFCDIISKLAWLIQSDYIADIVPILVRNIIRSYHTLIGKACLCKLITVLYFFVQSTNDYTIVHILKNTCFDLSLSHFTGHSIYSLPKCLLRLTTAKSSNYELLCAGYPAILYLNFGTLQHNKPGAISTCCIINVRNPNKQIKMTVSWPSDFDNGNPYTSEGGFVLS